MKSKPTNYNDKSFSSKGCDVTSSSCVVWNGPEIKELNICKGDNVTKVIYDLAQYIIEFKNFFNLDNYDLSCLVGKDCNPKDFEEFIQLLVNSVCQNAECCQDVKDIIGDGSESEQSGPAGPIQNFSVPNGGGNDNVFVPEPFFYKNEKGDTVKTLPLKSYVIAIGNKLVTTIKQVNELNQSIDQLNIDVEELKNKDDNNFELPQVIIEGARKEMNDAIEEFYNYFSLYKQVLGTPIQISTAISREPSKFNGLDKLDGGGSYAESDNWIPSSSNNLAGSINNIWIVLSDMYNYTRALRKRTDNICNDIDLSLEVDLVDDILKVKIVGDLPDDVLTVSPEYTLVIKDESNNRITKSFNVISHYNSQNPLNIDLKNESINRSDKLLIELPAVIFTDNVSYCEKYYNAFYDVIDLCPNLLNSIESDKIVSFFYWRGATSMVKLSVLNELKEIVSEEEINVSYNKEYFVSLDSLTADTDYQLVVNYKQDDAYIECNVIDFKTKS